MLATRFMLPGPIIDDLVTLRGTYVLIVASDCDSMAWPAATGTRWEELTQTLSVLVPILTAATDQGVGIKFLNDPSLYHIDNEAHLGELLRDQEPGGQQPLITDLEPALAGSVGNPQSPKKLVLVFTDGLPTDGPVARLAESMRQRRSPSVQATFVLCTKERHVVDEYARCVAGLPMTAISDDFPSEVAEARARGQHLTREEYAARIALAPTFPGRYSN